MTKTKKNNLVFVKTHVAASNVITISLKTLDFVNPIPLTPSFDNNNLIFGLCLTRLGNKQTIKETKVQS